MVGPADSQGDISNEWNTGSYRHLIDRSVLCESRALLIRRSVRDDGVVVRALSSLIYTGREFVCCVVGTDDGVDESGAVTFE